MGTTSAVATRLRGVWMSTADLARSREFYERLGAHYDNSEPVDGIAHATLGGIRLIFEAGHGAPPHSGRFMLFDVTDADALHQQLTDAGCAVDGPPRDEPWGRQFNVQDPDGHDIAFIGPLR